MPTLTELIVVHVQSFTIGGDTYSGLRSLAIRGNPRPRRAQRDEGAMTPTSFIQLPTDRPNFTVTGQNTSARILALQGVSDTTATVAGRDQAGNSVTVTLTNPYVRNVTLPPMNVQEGEQVGTIEIDATAVAVA